MADITAGLLSIGCISILAYLPLMCYLDWTERRVPLELFVGLLTINIPVTSYLYLTGILSIYHLISSLLVIAFAFFLWKKFGQGAFSAADRNLIICIGLFFFWNPFSAEMDVHYVGFISEFTLVWFIVWYIVVMCCLPLILAGYNLVTQKYKKGYKLWQMITQFGDRGIPMILPIAAAFILALVHGI
jgi:hypothetical protein